MSTVAKDNSVPGCVGPMTVAMLMKTRLKLINRLIHEPIKKDTPSKIKKECVRHRMASKPTCIALFLLDFGTHRCICIIILANFIIPKKDPHQIVQKHSEKAAENLVLGSTA